MRAARRMGLVPLAVRGALRNRVRSGLTVFGVIIAIAGLIVLVGLTRGLANAWQGSLVERGGDLVVFDRDAVDVLSGAVSNAVAEGAARIPGVRGVSAELVKLVTADDSAHVVLTGLSADSYTWAEMRIEAGRRPNAGEAGAVVLGSALAEQLRKRPGDTITLAFRPFRVVGIARFSEMLNARTAYVPLAEMQKLLDRANTVTFVHIKLADPGDAAAARVRGALRALDSGIAVEAGAAMVANNRVIGIFRAVSWSSTAIAIAMGVLVILNTMLMAVIERTAEIGILHAVGWSRERIVALFVVEGAVLAAVAAPVGLAAGYLAAQAITALPGVAGFLEPRIDARMLVEVAAAAILLGVLGSFYPALRAARLDPAAAMWR